MKTLNKISILALTSLLVLSSCETTELDLTSNPNALSPAQASADLFINEIQVDFAYMVNGLSGVGSRLTRINQLGGERLYRDEPHLIADLYDRHQTILAHVQSHQAPAYVKVLKPSWLLLDLW